MPKKTANKLHLRIPTYPDGELLFSINPNREDVYFGMVGSEILVILPTQKRFIKNSEDQYSLAHYKTGIVFQRFTKLTVHDVGLLTMAMLTFISRNPNWLETLQAHASSYEVPELNPEPPCKDFVFKFNDKGQRLEYDIPYPL